MTYWTCTIGELFEEASATLTGGRRLIASSESDYCPDVEVKANRMYIEAKACGRSGRVILYSRRATREEAWADEGNYEHFYHIWRHAFVTKEYTNEQELLIDTPNCVRELCIVPSRVLFEIARKEKERVVNRWNPQGYTRGWLIPYTKIRKVCEHHYSRTSLLVQATLPVKLKGLQIYSHEPLTSEHAIKKLKAIFIPAPEVVDAPF